MIRVARGAGARPEEVEALLIQYKKFSDLVKKMGGIKVGATWKRAGSRRRPLFGFLLFRFSAPWLAPVDPLPVPALFLSPPLLL